MCGFLALWPFRNTSSRYAPSDQVPDVGRLREKSKHLLSIPHVFMSFIVLAEVSIIDISSNILKIKTTEPERQIN